MAGDEVLIKCEGVSKRFCRSFKQSLWYGVKNIVADYAGSSGDSRPQLRPNEFWANSDITFEVRRGECLGLIGSNGSGKTTLLKILNGIIKPDAGRVVMRGRIGALIALGAGFDPLLTGRENIYVNGAILGLSRREINARFDEIVAFSELEEFLDSPVRNYSSGMQVRLGFSIAAILAQPDILLLDEVLAVGDMSFMLKCLNFIRDTVRDSAVVLVSHSQAHIANFCSHALVLETGTVAFDTADVYRAIDYYVASHHQSEQLPQQISGSGTVKLVNVETRPGSIERIGSDVPQEIEFDARVDILPECGSCTALIGVRSLANEPLAHMPLLMADGSPMKLQEGRQHIRAKLPVGDLNAGVYVVHLTVVEEETSQIALRVDNAGSFRVVSDEVFWGKLVRGVRAEVVAEA